ncbi:AraC family transcriptional regulator [Streptomyces chromofuscus]|uniref:Helix-turn-helix transcriptional regulator n=1 Tax=Streptomyces chromofuscus TaxID=42881 RepID=A0A7M2T7J1_STRCW|nr:AraC family transcriptional regulator [Streptomyces chromofuscus]QOV43648.1 helix-turn-helix transcriptional regulator [Streptomyces chromofuscus]GGT11135.1 hypothetical protein GCM10010254_34950 [Streptomyces chromofuscus]
MNAALPAQFAESASVEKSLPAHRLMCSADLGWRSLLARHYADPAEAEQFTTTPTRDLLVVTVTGGRYTIESRQGRTWARRHYRSGAIGVTAPGHSSTLRWRSLSHEPMRSLHLFLAAGLVEDTVEEFRAARLSSPVLPDALLLRDPLVEHLAHRILRAMEDKAPALYADSLAQALVVHLLYGPDAHPSRPAGPAVRGGGPGGGLGGGLGGKALRQVIDYMHDHLQEDIGLDELAAQVHISKFHLLRRFAEATGTTPHRYLTELRTTRAAALLATTDRSVLDIALECGYRSPGRFAAAFRRHHGMTPTDYRRLRADRSAGEMP